MADLRDFTGKNRKFKVAATLDAQGELRLADSDSSNYVGFKSPSTVSTNNVWTLPSADGTDGQTFTTNANDTLSYSNKVSNGFLVTAASNITKGDFVYLSSNGYVFPTNGTNPATLRTITDNDNFNSTSSTAFGRNVNASIACNTNGTLVLRIVPTSSGADISVVAGTVSNGVISFGTPLVITGNTLPNSSAMNVTFDPTSGNFVVYYFGAANTLTVRTISVSGTTCTANTAVTLANIDDDIRVLPAYYDSTADKHVVMVHPTATAYPSAVVVTVSGTTVTLAAAVSIVSTASTATFIWSDCHYNSTLNKGVFLFHNASLGVSLALGTISAGVISFGTALSTGLTQATTTTGSMLNAVPFVTYDNDQGKVLMLYGNGTGTTFTIYTYTVSGTTLTASTSYSVTSGMNRFYGIHYLSAPDSRSTLVVFGTPSGSDKIETWYFNSTQNVYTRDTIYETTHGGIQALGSSNAVYFGKLLYLNTGQRFLASQSVFSDVSVTSGCPCPVTTTTYYYRNNYATYDVPTINIYSYSPTSNPIRRGISRITISADSSVYENFISKGPYTHDSAIFTFNNVYYKDYAGNFTTSSTGTLAEVGTSRSTTVLL